MISVKSLSQKLIPNVYVKSLSLETNYQDKVTSQRKQTMAGVVGGTAKASGVFKYSTDRQLVPSDSISSDITLSIKFPRNPSNGANNGLLKLIESEFAPDYRIHIHKITNKNLFDQISAYNSDYYNSNGNLTEYGKSILRGVERPALPYSVISHKSIIVRDLFSNSQNFADNALLDFETVNLDMSEGSTETLDKLPTQILDDGTILTEIVSNLVFDDIPKETEFLGFIMISAVGSDDGSFEPVFSSLSKEIVILNGEFQDKGLIFNIAPFSPNNSSASELLKFGTPGDIWAGPVHYHEPTKTFMIGAKHSNNPHPVLDYTIVRNTKFVDNRVSEKIEAAIYDSAQAFNALNSEVSIYRSNKNNIDFRTVKQIPYISDVILTQDSIGNVQGYFTIDKPSTIKDKCYFKSYLDNIQALESKVPDLMLSNVLSLSKLIRCSIINNNKTLATVNEDNINTPQVFDFTTVENLPDQTVSFTLEKANIVAPSAGRPEPLYGETFLFKHKIGNQTKDSGPTISTQKYSVEAEYSDPTIDFVKYLRNSVSNALMSVQALIKFVDITSKEFDIKVGFNPITGKINSKVIDLLSNTDKDYGFGNSTSLSEASQLGQIAGVGLILDAILFLPYSYIYAFFYSPALQFQGLPSGAGSFYLAFLQFFLSCANMETTTLKNLSRLESTLSHMVNTFDAALKPVGASPPKTTKGSEAQYFEALKGNKQGLSKQKTIQIKSKNESMITTHDHGYDFTGAIDASDFKNLTLNSPAVASGEGRDQDSFIKININDYRALIFYNYSEISKFPYGDGINQTFKTTSIGAGGVIVTTDALMPSFLNTPAIKKSFLGSSVVLPPTVYTNKSPNPQIIFTSIAKLNKEILENNRLFMNQPPNKFGGQAIVIALAEDLITLHARQGVTFPGISQGQIVEGLPLFYEPDNDIPEGGESNEDDQTPSFIKSYTFEAGTVTKNTFMNSLFNKQLLNNNEKKYSFNYKKYINSLENSSAKEMFITNAFIRAGKEPLQVLCFATENPSEGPFKNYLDTDQGYIINGVIDPARLSQFFFLHQNIVEVQYLSGFKKTNYEIKLPEPGNPYTSKGIPVESTNVNVPRWRTLSGKAFANFRNDDTDSSSQLLCRVVRRDSVFINKHLVKQLEMPFINSHFILSKPS